MLDGTRLSPVYNLLSLKGGEDSGELLQFVVFLAPMRAELWKHLAQKGWRGDDEPTITLRMLPAFSSARPCSLTPSMTQMGCCRAHFSCHNAQLANDPVLQTYDLFFCHGLFVFLFILRLPSLCFLFTFVYLRSWAFWTLSSHMFLILYHMSIIFSHATYLLSHVYDISHVNHYHMPIFYHMLLYLLRL